nr:unnamed protein product [Callosobruchus analis]
MTGGLVQEYEHSILPSIHPIVTILLTVIFTLPAMIKLFNLNRQPCHFLRCLVLCALTSFLFGWHVHEKAILMAIIPLTYSLPLLNPLESTYLLGLGAVFIYENGVHQLLGLDKNFPFLPLMVTSAYCSLGVIYAWASYYVYFLKSDDISTRIKSEKVNKMD